MSDKRSRIKTRKTRKINKPDKKPQLSSPKERIFKLFLIAIPFIFFILLEIFLRAINYAEEIPAVQTFAAAPAYYQIHPELGIRYFPATKVKPSVAATDVFLKEKPADLYRIFVLGGSSAAGYPYLFNGSFSSILKTILAAYYPNRRIEIVNWAMPAISSYAVRDIALEISDYQPDLVLVYAGHNEFYGGLGVASVESLGRQRWLVNLFIGLRNYKTLTLLRDGLVWLRSASGKRMKDEGTLMERMVQEQHIPFGSDLYKQGSTVFQGNMADVVEHYEAKNIPVVIGTLVSNIRDQRPFVDVFAEETDQALWKKHFQEAKAAFESGKTRDALAALKKCVDIDSLPASQYFLKGEIAEAQGDAAAYHAFYRAKEFDGLRFRASETINRQVEKLATHANVSIAPIKKVYETASPNKLIGENLMLEHLHPNLDGYTLMAKTFANTIIEKQFLGAPHLSIQTESGNLPDSVWIDKCGVTAVDLEAARIRIDYLKSGWPFKATSPPPRARYHIPNPTPLQKLALRYWLDELTWEQLHVEMAQHYSKQKNWEKAAAEYQALVHATPANSAPYIFLGQALMNQNKFEEALTVFNQAIEIEPGAYAYKMIGSIYLQKKQAGRAIIYLEKAVQADRRDLQSLFSLAQAYAAAGKFQPAKTTINAVLSARPDYPGAKQLAQFLEKQEEKVKKNKPE